MIDTPSRRKLAEAPDGKGCADTGVEGIAQCILFLHSDLPWEWPPTRISFVTLLCNIGTFGVAARRAAERYRAAGEFAVWPFFRQADYESKLANPKLLRGAI